MNMSKTTARVIITVCIVLAVGLIATILTMNIGHYPFDMVEVIIIACLGLLGNIIQAVYNNSTTRHMKEMFQASQNHLFDIENKLK